MARLVRVGMWAAAAALGVAVLLVPVDWPISDLPPPGALFPVGPVSADVVGGQTLAADESFEGVALPIRVGGPIGATANLGLAVYGDVSRTIELAQATSVVASGPAEFAPALFRLGRRLEAHRELYIELQVPANSAWPILVAGSKGDPARGRLYLRGEPGWPDQDLAYQLFRRSGLLQRLVDLWSTHRAAAVTAVVTLVTAVGAALGLGLVLGQGKKSPGYGPAATLAFAVMAAAAYFYVFS